MAVQAAPRIRHIATHLHRDDIVVLAEFEKTAHLCSIEPPRVLNTLETVLDGGGQRVALCAIRSGPVIVAAA